MSDLRYRVARFLLSLVDFMSTVHTTICSVKPNVRIVAEAPTTATIDGGGGLGLVPGTIGMKLAIEKARDAGGYGVGAQQHALRPVPYALMALDAT